MRDARCVIRKRKERGVGSRGSGRPLNRPSLVSRRSSLDPPPAQEMWGSRGEGPSRPSLATGRLTAHPSQCLALDPESPLLVSPSGARYALHADLHDRSIRKKRKMSNPGTSRQATIMCGGLWFCLLRGAALSRSAGVPGSHRERVGERPLRVSASRCERQADDVASCAVPSYTMLGPPPPRRAVPSGPNIVTGGTLGERSRERARRSYPGPTDRETSRAVATRLRFGVGRGAVQPQSRIAVEP